MLRQQLARIVRRIPKLMLIPYYTYRFFQPKYSIGVVGVVINKHQQVLLVEHVFHPKLPWGLPGGWIGFNENPETTIAREILEELELRVTVKHLLLIQRTKYHHIDIAYLCEPQGEIGTVSYELLKYSWVSRSDLPVLHTFHYEAIEAAFSCKKKEV